MLVSQQHASVAGFLIMGTFWSSERRVMLASTMPSRDKIDWMRSIQ